MSIWSKSISTPSPLQYGRILHHYKNLARNHRHPAQLPRYSQTIWPPLQLAKILLLRSTFITECSSFSENLKLLGVTFILLVVVPLPNTKETVEAVGTDPPARNEGDWVSFFSHLGPLILFWSANTYWLDYFSLTFCLRNYSTNFWHTLGD